MMKCRKHLRLCKPPSPLFYYYYSFSYLFFFQLAHAHVNHSIGFGRGDGKLCMISPRMMVCGLSYLICNRCLESFPLNWDPCF